MSDPYLYTPYYCEENVWHLCQRKELTPLERKVVFISNESRSCPLWQQRACRSEDEPIFWDYHVVLMCRGLPAADPATTKPDATETSWHIYDQDSLLGMPVNVGRYLNLTFLLDETVISQLFAPLFRVIDADTFLKTFSSDRRHMILPSGLWQSAPPPWPAIVQGPTQFNLMQFVDMKSEFFGNVLDLPRFVECFCEPAIC